jgi:hypothetical protein
VPTRANMLRDLREISHVQVGQCGNQDAQAEVLCRRRRAVRAIAARVVRIMQLIFTPVLYISAEPGRRRPTPRLCTACAGGITAAENCVGAAA